jgi:hypothetical protein
MTTDGMARVNNTPEAHEGTPVRRRVSVATLDALQARLIERLQPGWVITVYEAQLVLQATAEIAEAALLALARRARLDHPTKHVWIRPGAHADPYRVGARITAPYAFAGETALTLHHLRTTRQLNRILVASPSSFADFTYGGVEYRHVDGWNETLVLRIQTEDPGPAVENLHTGKQPPEMVLAASLEQCVLDYVLAIGRGAEPAPAGNPNDFATAIQDMPLIDASRLLMSLDPSADRDLIVRLSHAIAAVACAPLDGSAVQNPTLRSVLASAVHAPEGWQSG